MMALELPPDDAAPPANLADDEARLMRMAQDDPALFAPVYERYFERVYAYCLRRTGDAQEAEDLCSQVFTQALVGLRGYRGGMAAAWLFRIAHNVVANHYRGRRALVSLDDLDLADERSREALERSDDGDILSRLVAALPEDQRNLLALALDGGLTSRQAGAALGKSAGAVRVKLHRIIKRLREQYEKVTGEGRQ